MKMNMKYIWVIVMIAAGLTSCDDNDVMPSYKKVGTSTHTMASISVSKSKPAPSETITVTLNYVNPSADPIVEVALTAQIGAGGFAEVQSFDVQSEAKDVWLSKTVNYQVPAVSGTPVVFDMVITSGKDSPQMKRATVTVN